MASSLHDIIETLITHDNRIKYSEQTTRSINLLQSQIQNLQQQIKRAPEDPAYAAGATLCREEANIGITVTCKPAQPLHPAQGCAYPITASRDRRYTPPAPCYRRFPGVPGSGASAARRAGRSGLAMNGTPNATASALPVASAALAVALVKRSLTMYRPLEAHRQRADAVVRFLLPRAMRGDAALRSSISSA